MGRGLRLSLATIAIVAAAAAVVWMLVRADDAPPGVGSASSAGDDEIAPRPAGQGVEALDTHLAGARAAASRDPDAPGRVHARVVRAPDGAPVRGVPLMVEVLEDGARRSRGIGWTDDRGEVLVEPVPPGTDYRVRIQPAAQPAVDRTDVAVLAGETTDLGVVTLTAAGLIDGLVLDEARNPIEKAHVAVTIDPDTVLTLDRDPWPLDPDPPGTMRHLETDDRGRFRLEGVPPGLAAVRATIAGHRAATHRVLVPAQGPDSAWVVFVLGSGRAVGGRVTLSDGRPALGARVEMGPDGIDTFEVKASVEADEDGNFLFQGLGRIDTVDLRVTPRETKDGGPVVFGHRRVGSPQLLALPLGVRLEVVVLDEATQAPVESARVLAGLGPAPGPSSTGDEDERQRPAATPVREGWTDAEGRVSLDVPAGPLLRVEVRHPGRRTLVVGGGMPLPRTGVIGDVRTSVPAGGTRSLRLTLERGLPLTGVVRSPAGVPLAGVVVTLFPGGDDVAVSRATDVQGRYRFESVVPERFPRIAARAPGGAFAPEAPVRGREIRGEPHLEQDLDLREGSTVLGTVRDGAGRPVAGARVRVLPGDAMAWTDGAGRYRIGGLDGTIDRRAHRSVKVTIEVVAESIGGGSAVGVILEPASEVEAPAIVLGAAGEIRGVVLDAAGNRVRFPVIELVDGDTGAVLRTQAGEEFGDYLLRAVPPGTYAVRARLRDTAGRSMEVLSVGWRPDAIVPFTEIRLAPLREVVGHVIDSDGAPVAGARLRLRVGGSSPRSADPMLEILDGVADAEGRFELSTFRLPEQLEVLPRRGKGESLDLKPESATVEVRLKGRQRSGK